MFRYIWCNRLKLRPFTRLDVVIVIAPPEAETNPSDGTLRVSGSSQKNRASTRGRISSLNCYLLREGTGRAIFCEVAFPVCSTGPVSVGANSAAGGQTVQPAACDICFQTVGVIAQKSAERLRSVFIAAHGGKRLRYQELDFRRLPVGGH